MKVLNVSVTKTRMGGTCHYGYPDGYDATKVSPIIYQEEGGDPEGCLAVTKDDFTATDKMVVTSNEDATILISDWVDDNINYGKLTDEEKEAMKAKIELMLPTELTE